MFAVVVGPAVQAVATWLGVEFDQAVAAFVVRRVVDTVACHQLSKLVVLLQLVVVLAMAQYHSVWEAYVASLVGLRYLHSSDWVLLVRIALAALKYLVPVDTWKWVPVVVAFAVV